MYLPGMKFVIISETLCVQVTVQRDNLRINNQQDAPSIQNLLIITYQQMH
jgi:hypothetical protein